MANKRKKCGAQQRKPLFQSEKYSIQALHEDREYGMYWYAWLWKIVRPALIFLCSALICCMRCKSSSGMFSPEASLACILNCSRLYSSNSALLVLSS